MYADLLAVLAAVCYALSQTAVKLGTADGHVKLGLLTSLLTGTVSIGIVAALTVSDWSPSLSAVAWFAAAGVVGPGVGRFLIMWGIREVGASVTVPLHASVQPLVATLAGVGVFGEVVSGRHAVAVGALLVGIWLCARGGSANRESVQLAGTPLPRAAPHLLIAAGLPLAAGGAYAAADVIRKHALDLHADPILGSLIGMLVAAAGWWTVTIARVDNVREFTPNLVWFGVHGLLSAVAQTLVLFALIDGDLSVVSPIVASQTVIIILLTALFLRKVEVLRPAAIVGAVMVFGGVASISMR